MNYLVGIGAQKAGTTWLADYFYAHPEVFMAPYKEMHYFDSYHNIEQVGSNFRLYMRRRAIDLTKYGPQNFVATPEQSSDLHRLYLRTCFRSDRAYKAFLDYGAEDKRVSAEITPAYTDLSFKGYRHIARCLPDVKLLLIARNPIDRFVSQVRMDRRYGKKRGYEPISYQLSHFRYRRKGDYRRTLTEAERAVDQSRIHVVFFERLFDSAQMAREIARICSFVGVSYVEPPTVDKSNAARDKSFVLDADQRREVARHYEDVMRFMARYEGGLPESWQADLDRI
jgi:hypothetical protein